MKLSKKVPLLIIPVLATCFLFISAGLYVLERNTIHSLTRSSLEMESAELAGSFSQYNLVAEGILASIIQSDALRRFLSSQDDQMKSIALGSGLDSTLNYLSGLTSDHFSLMFTKGDGKQEYYYENSLDPFAEPAPEVRHWVDDLFSSQTPSATYYFPDLKRLGLCRIVDRLTLNKTMDYSSENSLAIIVTLSPTEYLNRVKELGTANRIINFIDKAENLPAPDLFESRRAISGFGTISVQIVPEVVSEKFRRTLLRFSMIFLGLLALTHFTLQWLLGRYVIGPIDRLEEQLGDIDLDATHEIEVHESNDEIGSLSRSFATLYGKLKETYEDTKELAERDTLTTLYNRRVFNLVLSKLISRAEKDRTNVSLMYIDIDNFKYVNDYYGHAAGDALLKAFAFKLHDTVRGSDIIIQKSKQDTAVARLAGDEFAVIVHGFSDEKAVGRIASRILNICHNGFTCDEGTFPITLSIGIANYPQDGSTANDLTVNADSAMYESKKSGKNTVSFYSKELSELSRRQQALEIELKKFNFNEFELHYMPIINADTGQINSFEALLRWFSPELGQVSPAEFIPLAESLGIYREIDLWVLDRAFEQSRELRKLYGEHIRVSINISAAELSRSDFIDGLFALLQKHDVTPYMFTLEITETFYQDQSEGGLAVLNSLSKAGFQLAIDDLGSGYTSLLQLVEFPVNMVKLDRTFVDRTIATGKFGLLESLVKFCHAQNLSVTAEGVERNEDAVHLMQAGCNYLQGFYFSKPVSFEKLLHSTAETLLSKI